MISGAERLSLRHVEMGSFAVPPLFIDASGLLALAELVQSLTHSKVRA